MKVDVICTNQTHPINLWLRRWSESCSGGHEINLHAGSRTLAGGDFLFLISCSEVITKAIRDRYKNVLVLHASDLPNGKGWSPHVWTIINGGNEIVLTMLEAEDSVDSGKIWSKRRLPIPDHFLSNEIEGLLFDNEIEMMEDALKFCDSIIPVEQPKKPGSSYCRKRNPADSEIDPSQSISSQFDLIRICNPAEYPAYFYLRGKKYKLLLEKFDE